MKQKNLYLFLIALSILFCGCGTSSEIKKDPILTETEHSSESLTPTVNQPVTPDIPIVIQDDTLPPEEGMVRSRLTNEWIAADVANTRPIAVMIPNERSAIPHYSLHNAAILYEANVEARMTRLMAVYDDWQDKNKIGNIRSTRTYYAYWAFEWDAFLVHYGGPYYINELMSQENTENIDGLSGFASAYYRDQTRSDPHNVYTSGPLLKKQILKKGYDLSYRGLTEDSHFLFAPKAAPNTLQQYGNAAQNASYIDMSGCYPLTRCYFEYNENDGLYYRSQHLSGSVDGPHTDASGEQLTFKNILVQYTKQDILDTQGYLVLQCHDTTRDGWFFTNGRGIHVNWRKETDYGATKYYDDAGNEIELNTGKTMICIVNEKDSFTFR